MANDGHEGRDRTDQLTTGIDVPSLSFNEGISVDIFAILRFPKVEDSRRATVKNENDLLQDGMAKKEYDALILRPEIRLIIGHQRQWGNGNSNRMRRMGINVIPPLGLEHRR